MHNHGHSLFELAASSMVPCVHNYNQLLFDSAPDKKKRRDWKRSTLQEIHRHYYNTTHWGNNAPPRFTDHQETRSPGTTKPCAVLQARGHVRPLEGKTKSAPWAHGTQKLLGRVSPVCKRRTLNPKFPSLEQKQKLVNRFWSQVYGANNAFYPFLGSQTRQALAPHLAGINTWSLFLCTHNPHRQQPAGGSIH